MYPLSQLFWGTQCSVFVLIKKIFLQPLVEIIFRYHFRVLDPLGPTYEQNEKFYMWGHGYQNSVKRERWVIFWRNFWKIFKNEGFGPKFWDTQYKIFFALIKKIFLQPLIEIIFRYHSFFNYSFGTPWNIMSFFYIWGVGYQKRVKRVSGVHF